MTIADKVSNVILASSSPRRKELLRDAGIEFSVVVSGCDETQLEGESAQAMVERLALAKAEEVAVAHPEALVIGADTTVSIDGRCLGKPETPDEAFAMLQRTRGRTHEVWGGFAIVRKSDGVQIVQSYLTKVRMVEMSDEAIRDYVASGEPMDKAGAYAIQGLGLQFVEGIGGSYSNVVGLNIAAVMRALRPLLSPSPADEPIHRK